MLSILVKNLSLLLSLACDTDSSWRKQYDIIIPTENVFVVKQYYQDTINPVRIERRWKAGVVDRHGAVIVPLKYDDIGKFSEGLAEVVNGVGSACSSCWDADECGIFYTGQHGFIDKRGKVVIPLKYRAVGEFHEGVAWVNLEHHQYYYIDKRGQRAFPFMYKMVRRFEGRMAPVDVKGGQVAKGEDYNNYIDHTGKLLIPTRYSFIEPYQPDGLRAFARGGKWGFLDTTARQVIPPTYSWVSLDKETNWQGLRLIALRGQYGYIRSVDGTVVIPPQYDSLLIASKQLIWARKDSYWGALDAANQVQVPFEYDAVRPFYDQLASVKKNGNWGYINTSGQLRVPTIYQQASYFRDGLALIQRNTKWGFVNTSGDEVIEPIYDYVTVFESGEAKARWNFIYLTVDRQGNWLSWMLHPHLKQVALAAVVVVLLVYGRYARKKRQVHSNIS